MVFLERDVFGGHLFAAIYISPPFIRPTVDTRLFSHLSCNLNGMCVLYFVPNATGPVLWKYPTTARLRIFHWALLCARKSDCHSNGGCNMSNRPSAGTRMLGMAEIALSIKHAERGQWNITSAWAASSPTPLQYPYPVLPLTHLLKPCTNNLTTTKVNREREKGSGGANGSFWNFISHSLQLQEHIE